MWTLLGLFWALNGLDATLTLLGLSRGATELNPLWANYSPLNAMILKLDLALLAGLWFQMKGWHVALWAGCMWLGAAVAINITTLAYLALGS